MKPDRNEDRTSKVDGPAPSFTRAMVTSFLIFSTSVLIVLIPLLGPILAFTLVPYFASALGTRRAHPRERIPVSLTSSITWSVIETTVLVIIVSSVRTPGGFVLESLGLFLIAIIWAGNIGFGILGALHPWNDPFKDYSRY